jgi:hypothetical protein
MTPPHFCNYLPFEEDLALLLNNLEFPLHKDHLYQVWLKLACCLWKWFLKIFSVFLLICYYLPLDKGLPLHLNKNDLCKVCLKLAQWFWKRTRKCKSLQTDGWTDGKTDFGQQRSEKLTWAFCSGELKTWKRNKPNF